MSTTHPRNTQAYEGPSLLHVPLRLAPAAQMFSTYETQEVKAV
jgi:hypothetical protein